MVKFLFNLIENDELSDLINILLKFNHFDFYVYICENVYIYIYNVQVLTYIVTNTP